MKTSQQFIPVPQRDFGYQPPNKLQRAIESACQALVNSEALLTKLDQAVGDGDLGVSLARGAKAVEESLPVYQLYDPPEALKAIGMTLQNVVGGSSGPFYGVLLLRAATALRSEDPGDPKAWAKATLEGCEAVSKLGDARVGDRTMLDALVPFARTLAAGLENGQSTRDALEQAARAAEKGAEATANILARRGRSSYLGERVLGHPDPGAVAAAIWLRAAVSAV